MVKKPNINISAIAVIRAIVFLIIGFVLFSAYTTTQDFLKNSSIFKVKEVLIDSSIQFIDMRMLKDLKGRSIFAVDIKKVERQIARSYPQISQLRVVRQLPDRIKVLAKKREPFAQILVKGKILVIDKEAVSLYYVPQNLPVPVITGIPLERGRIVLGAKVPTKELSAVMLILNEFKNRPRLAKLQVRSIDGSNLSKIELSLPMFMRIIIDQEQIMAKIDMLEMLLNQNKVDFNRLKYIDLRFREPVIADNEEQINASKPSKAKE